MNRESAREATGPETRLVIEAAKGWEGLGLRDLWRYRELAYFLTWRDIKVRYKQTLLGASWAVLQPVLTMIVFSIIFGQLAHLPSEGIPYPIFTYTALLPWQLFAFALANSSNSLVGSQNLVSKVYFPRLVIPIASVLPALVDFAISFVVLAGMLVYYRIPVTPAIFTLPLFLLLALATALAAGIWLSALNVEYRDVRYVVPFLTLFWQYATPVAYSASLIPAKWRVLYGLNPMAGVVEGFRWALLGKGSAGELLWISVGIVMLMLLGGLMYFRRMEASFADVIRMTDTVIRAEHLGKRYRIGGAQAGYKTLREALLAAAGAPIRWIRGARQAPNTFWALDDVSFDVDRGQAVGIIGRNGAGKSTLLKILSRITRPTRGRVELQGRVSALLEVGTGFHGELTGRENIFLNGAILGMGRDEIKRKFDQIVDFAGIDQFLDTAVKYYSSGMYVRLAFAVAAHLEPEILVVDEVLAVGDAEFQKKCLNKMGTAAREGRTVLFVSHNMSAIQDLCSRALWLDAGRIVRAGDAKSTVAAYLSMQARERKEQSWADLSTAPGNETVRVVHASVQADRGYDAAYWTVETPLTLSFRIFNFRPDLPLYLNFHVYNQQGVCVFNTASARGLQPRGIVEGVCRIPGNLLNDDTYSVKFMAHYRGTFGVVVEDAVVFEINDVGRDGIDYYGKWSGVTRPKLDWRVRWVGGTMQEPEGSTT